MLGLVCLLGAGPGRASVVVDGLGAVARELSSGYSVKRPDVRGETLAVFTFRCPPDLEKRQVGYAVAELLIGGLAETAKFKIVERSELTRVLDEHALGLTGALDQDTTVRIGRLLGAKLGVMGSVDALGNQYQVTARIVDLESGEVLANAFRELPREAFDAEAGRYLNLVPDEQAIGIYLAAGWGPTGAAIVSPVTVPGDFGTTYTLTQDAPSSSGGAAGLGVRYLVLRWLLADLSFWPKAFKARFTGTVAASGGAGMAPVLEPQYISGAAGELGVYWIGRVVSRYRVRAGAAFVTYSLDQQGAGGPPSPDRLRLEHLNPWLVRLQGGLEWRPGGRFGIGMTVFATPMPVEDRLTFVTDTAEAASIELPRFGARIEAGLYF